MYFPCDFDAGDSVEPSIFPKESFDTMPLMQLPVSTGQLTLPGTPPPIRPTAGVGMTGSLWTPFSDDLGLGSLVAAPALPAVDPFSSTPHVDTTRERCTYAGCNATFGRGAEFRRHVRTVHKRHEAGGYQCLYQSCGYSYPRIDKVRSHMEKMHGLRVEKI